MLNCRADTHLLKSVHQKSERRKRGGKLRKRETGNTRRETWRYGRAGDASPPSGSVAPGTAKAEKKYLRMILWACLSAIFLGVGSLASGLLSQEENRDKCNPSFSGRADRNRRLHFLFLPFLAGNFPKAKGPVHLYAARGRSPFTVRRSAASPRRGIPVPGLLATHRLGRLIADKSGRHFVVCVVRYQFADDENQTMN